MEQENISRISYNTPILQSSPLKKKKNARLTPTSARIIRLRPGVSANMEWTQKRRPCCFVYANKPPNAYIAVCVSEVGAKHDRPNLYWFIQHSTVLSCTLPTTERRIEGGGVLETKTVRSVRDTELVVFSGFLNAAGKTENVTKLVVDGSHSGVDAA